MGSLLERVAGALGLDESAAARDEQVSRQAKGSPTCCAYKIHTMGYITHFADLKRDDDAERSIGADG
jgi:hypothetical protein